MSLYQQYIAKSKYARYLDDKKRREHWPETVKRYFDFMTEHLAEKCNYTITEELRQDLESAVLNLEVMPSMRLMMTAGEAARRSHIGCFNCAFVPIDSVASFDELMLILMNGTGIGFSVEAVHTNKLPEVPDTLFESGTTIAVSDSKESWSKSLRQLIALLYSGEIPKWDVSKVRPKGERLKTFGGRASGSAPLVDLFTFVVKLFKGAVGRRLYTIECHDICCKIAEIVIVGSVRRCLPIGSKVNTNKGFVNIEDLSIGDLVKSEDGAYNKVLAKEAVGKMDVYKLKTNIGSFYSTLDHRWAVLDNPATGELSYKELRDIIPYEDRLVFINTSDKSREEVSFPEFKYEKTSRHSTTCRDISVKALSNIEWSWFLGLIHGDGYVSLSATKGSVSVAVPYDMPNTRDKVVSFFSRLGVNSSISTDEVNDRCWKVRTESKQLATYLAQFKVPKAAISVPKCVTSSSEQCRFAYLAGIFDSDGSAKSKRAGRKSFRLVSTVYKSYAEELKAMLSDLGIPGAFNISDRSRYGWQDMHNLQICGPDNKNYLAEKLAPYSEKIINDFNNCASKRDWFSLPVSLTKSLVGVDFVLGATTSWNKLSKFCEKKMYTPITLFGIEKLNEAIDCYDLQVEASESFCVNGLLTHNSALLSGSDLNDTRMRNAKIGDWWNTNPQRALSNNSAVYREKPEIGQFVEEWLSLYNSKAGERGIYNHVAIKKQVEKNGRREYNEHMLTNPCSEIILNKNQFCNLSTVIIQPEDTEENLLRKVRLASILGTFQASLTNFPYLRKSWKQITEKEALIGVSLCGILDNKLTYDQTDSDLPRRLEALKEKVVETNKEFAELLGINQATATTCIKPEGTTSQLCNVSSGIHGQHSKYYIRTIRSDSKDPITDHLKAAGVPNEPCVWKSSDTTIFSFPKKAPEGALLREDLTAIEHLNLWLIYQRHYCEHKPSITISVKEHEWLDVAAWVYKNWDEMTGVSFLPYDLGTYKQAPYQEITKDRYEEMASKMPTSIDWDSLLEYEDNVEGCQTLACSGGSCEL